MHAFARVEAMSAHAAAAHTNSGYTSCGVRHNIHIGGEGGGAGARSHQGGRDVDGGSTPSGMMIKNDSRSGVKIRCIYMHHTHACIFT